MPQVDSETKGAVRLERIGAIGRVTLDPAGGPGTVGDWRHWVAACDRWIDDPNVYGALIRRAGQGALRALQNAETLPDLADFYRLIWTIDRFSKPTVALIDGKMSWADFCLVRHGTHKVVGDSFELDFGVGGSSFTDAGATWWLARLPGNIGEFLALTGVEIDGADALALGLATHRISTASFELIEGAYAEADPIDQVLDGLPPLTGGGSVERIAGPAAAAFGERDYESIVSTLAAMETDLAGVIGGRLASGHRVAKPDLVLSLVREARGLTLKQTLERDFALALAVSGDGQTPFADMKPGGYELYRLRAAKELALRPPPAVPEALG
jgi:enoyl-CoA hydratase